MYCMSEIKIKIWNSFVRKKEKQLEERKRKCAGEYVSKNETNAEDFC